MRFNSLIGNKLLLLATILCFVCPVNKTTIALAANQVHQSPRVNSSIAPLPLKGKVIVVDPGHGGSDSGARQKGFREQDLTLAISIRLKQQLESKGARVIMTRDRAKEVSLEERVKISNSTNPAVFISVHINASGDGSHRLDGIETYYYAPQSKPLAQSVYRALVVGLEAHGNWVAKKEFYVVHHNKAPAVLAEVGYMTNRRKLRKLISPDYQEQIASSLATGIVWYFFGAPNTHTHRLKRPSSIRKRHTPRQNRAKQIRQRHRR